MRLLAKSSVIAALLSSGVDGHAQPPRTMPDVGDEHEIIRSYETSQVESDGSSGSSQGSSGSSQGSDAFLERVIALRDGGLELEYGLPKDATTQDRSRNWQFPARVFRSADGSTRLLNGPELEVRLDGWLKAAKWTRAACGRWIFTWNAFRIECDPQSVVKAIDALDLRPADLRAGALHWEAGTLGPGTLTMKSAGPGGATFAATMEIDPDAVRRTRAESDVALGELMRKPTTLDEALRERARQRVSGTVSVIFNTDRAGNVRRRIKVTELETKGPDKRSERETITETVEGRRASGLPPQP